MTRFFSTSAKRGSNYSSSRTRARFISAALLTLGAFAGVTALEAVAPQAAHAQSADLTLVRVDRPDGGSGGPQRDCFLTTNMTEVGGAMANAGYRTAVTLGKIYSTSTGSYNQPLYRLQKLGYHFYTIDAAERSSALSGGWTDEGTIGYVKSPSATLNAGDRQVFRFMDQTYAGYSTTGLSHSYTNLDYRTDSYNPTFINNQYVPIRYDGLAEIFPFGTYYYEGVRFVIRTQP